MLLSACFRGLVHFDVFSCSNFCRIPIIDYHRHCSNCSYDLCLNCSQDLREDGEARDSKIGEKIQEKEIIMEERIVPRVKLNLSAKCPDWKANSDGSIPCPPKEYGGCGYSSLSLSRIFKMNWVAKLVKNVEEMVNGCRVDHAGDPDNTGFDDPKHSQYAHREDSDDNFLYCPATQDIKSDGIDEFRKHWARGKPIIIKHVFDISSISLWDPMVIWRGIRDTVDERSKDENRTVKAKDCLDWTEVSSKSYCLLLYMCMCNMVLSYLVDC